jgi:hypothetical protein
MLRHERQRDDLSEVRSCLDDATRALNEADRCHRDLHGDLGNHDKIVALMNAGRRLDEVKHRLAIRFGSDHEVTTAMTVCVELSLKVYTATTQRRLGERAYARKQGKLATTEFEPAWRDFISAAIRHAGVDLPAQTTTG